MGTSYMRPHSKTNSNQIFAVIKADDRKIFTGLTTPRPGQKKICDSNADVQSVCGS